ncbi:MAG: methyltransferase domain-containing protein [Thermomicrobiales bacterium]
MADDAKERVRAQYGAAGDAYVKSVGHATGNDLQRMVELAQPQPSDRLLDIATGGGHVARVFAPKVARVVASDLTPEILHHAKASFEELGLATIETRIADAEALPFEDGSFEIVTCRIAPHHFPNPDRFVTEVERVLAPGGRFVLVDSTVPDGDAGAFFNRVEKLRDPSHVRSLTIGEWRALIEAAELKLTIAESFPKRHDFEDWTSRSRMTSEDRDALGELVLAASDELKQILKVEEADNRVSAFSDTKTLFVARKS